MRVNPICSASRMRRLAWATPRTSPPRPTSPNTAVPCGIGRLVWECPLNLFTCCLKAAISTQCSHATALKVVDKPLPLRDRGAPVKHDAVPPENALEKVCERAGDLAELRENNRLFLALTELFA